MLRSLTNCWKFMPSSCLNCRSDLVQRCFFSRELEKKYTDSQKEKILQVINDSEASTLSSYDVTKGRLKQFARWKNSNGQVKTLSDIELVEGFSEKSAKKLFDSILDGPPKNEQKVLSSKIKGQFLQPNLSEAVRQSCKSVVSVYISVNSVCWTLIDRSNYEVLEWQYHSIDYPEGKRFQITDILDIAWNVAQKLPTADIYVMKAEATTLRAAGSDPNNPKVIAVNLQKAQMVAMIVALINARNYHMSSLDKENSTSENDFSQKVYFLRPTLPYRLYGTLVGNEKVSTDQTVEMILQKNTERSPNKTHVYFSESVKSTFRCQKELQKDMLGHCLLLGLTFMDICIYMNQESLNKLTKRGE